MKDQPNNDDEVKLEKSEKMMAGMEYLDEKRPNPNPSSDGKFMHMVEAEGGRGR